ncbi:hypothetical protein MBLNU459_g1438t1 [Dothideomycetes sp. NU459]
MNDYLHKEQRNPHSTDVRVRDRNATERRRRPTDGASQQRSERRDSAQTAAAPVSNVWWSSTPPSSSNGDTRSSSISSQPLHDSEGSRASESPEVQRRAPVLTVQTNHEAPSIPRRQSDTLSALVPRRGMRIVDRVPYDMAFSKAYGLSDMSARLDPFPTEPRFDNSEIDVENLKRTCSFYFGSDAMNRKWVPLMLQSRESFLSTLCISTAYVDILRTPPPGSNTRPTASIRTNAVFEEIIRLLKVSIGNPDTSADDSTIVAVVQLLCGEMMVRDDYVLQWHEAGLWSMVAKRGGLDQLGGNGAIADTLTITNFNLAIFRESQPLGGYLTYAKSTHTKTPETNPKIKLPESPLYCPLQDYSTINRSQKCTPSTLAIIKMTRDLTQVALMIHDIQSREVHFAGPRVAGYWQALQQQSNLIFGILALPKDDHGDDTYESVRLCARIYASAIQQKVPLSVAANPSASSRSDIIDCKATPLMVKETLMRTDIPDCWNSMVGVLFWITLVAGAACNAAPQPPPRRASIGMGGLHEENPTELELTRRWLIAVGIRCSVLLSFEHTTAVVQTLNKLLAVQDMLADRPKI